MAFSLSNTISIVKYLSLQIAIIISSKSLVFFVCVNTTLVTKKNVSIRLTPRQRLGDGALAVEQREQDVVRRRVVPPAEDLRDVVVPTAAAFRRLFFEAANVAASGGGEAVALD